MEKKQKPQGIGLQSILASRNCYVEPTVACLLPTMPLLFTTTNNSVQHNFNHVYIAQDLSIHLELLEFHLDTLLGTNISHTKALFKMIFLFPRWVSSLEGTIKHPATKFCLCYAFKPPSHRCQSWGGYAPHELVEGLWIAFGDDPHGRPGWKPQQSVLTFRV